MPTKITGYVDNQPWCEAIDFYDIGLLHHYLINSLPHCRRLLVGEYGPKNAAPFDEDAVSVRKLSQMRLHTTRSSTLFKDVRDDEGNTIPGGRERGNMPGSSSNLSQAMSMAE